MPESLSLTSPSLSITLLGAGQEVGRSCCVLQYRGKTVVCDVGVHPAYSGMASLPFIDALDWSTVDAILITHFHMDHAAALPYIAGKTNFLDGKGKIYMTHATLAMYKLVMQDYVRMGGTSTQAQESLYMAADLSTSLEHIIPVEVHQTIAVCPGVSFTPCPAGHVLGACMFHVDIAGATVLYTGDYSREENRHLVPASLPPSLGAPHVLIVESTFGVQMLEPRADKEEKFLNLVRETLERGGHVLIPVLALGMAQELLLVLEEYWSAHPELDEVPVYYSSNIAKKAMAIYQTFIRSMDEKIQSRFANGDNPFVFKHILHLRPVQGVERRIASGSPCVVLASPAMLQKGMSRELLESWAPDARNTVIITGSSTLGTLARDITRKCDSFLGQRGNIIQRKIQVEEISFSAHVDYAQNAELIESVRAQHVVFVHGQKDTMQRLREAMEVRFRRLGQNVQLHTPANVETLKLAIPQERIVIAVGDFNADPGAVLSGLLVCKDYAWTLVDRKDLSMLDVVQSEIIQSQKVVVECGIDTIKLHLEEMFGRVEDLREAAGLRVLSVMEIVEVIDNGSHELMLRWTSSAVNDMIADAVLALILRASSVTDKLKTGYPHVNSTTRATSTHESHTLRARGVADFLEAHLGNFELVLPNNLSDSASLVARLDDTEVTVDIDSMRVTCANVALKNCIERIVDMALITVTPLAQWPGPCAPQEVTQEVFQ